MRTRLLAFGALSLLLTSIGTASAGAPGGASGDRVAAAYTATVETPANFDDEAGGDANADDPAIYVADRPASSVVLGTLKNGGLDAFDLAGRRIQHLDVPPAPGDDLEEGRFNNVDVLTGTDFGDLAVVTDRGRDRLRSYRVSPRGAAAGARVLTNITSPRATRLFSATEPDVEEQRTGYGLALRAHRGATYAVVSRRSTSVVGLFRLRKEAGGVGYRRTDKLVLPERFRLSDGTTWTPCGEPGEGPQVEGMVVDRQHDVVYAAQEDVGVWRIPLRRESFGRPVLIDRVREFGRAATYDPETEECTISTTPHRDSGTHLAADAEGLTIVGHRHRSATLIVSSQGDNRFAEYTLRGRYLRTFVVAAGAVDSVEHSDGAAVTTTPLGPRFPTGLLVVHDGENTPAVTADGEVRENTNFKFVRWSGR